MDVSCVQVKKKGAEDGRGPRKRGLCCYPVRVRPSVTFVYCIQTAKDIIKLYSRHGCPIILVFDHLRRYLIPS